MFPTTPFPCHLLLFTLNFLRLLSGLSSTPPWWFHFLHCFGCHHQLDGGLLNLLHLFNHNFLSFMIPCSNVWWKPQIGNPTCTSLTSAVGFSSSFWNNHTLEHPKQSSGDTLQLSPQPGLVCNPLPLLSCGHDLSLRPCYSSAVTAPLQDLKPLIQSTQQPLNGLDSPHPVYLGTADHCLLIRSILITQLSKNLWPLTSSGHVSKGTVVNKTGFSNSL